MPRRSSGRRTWAYAGGSGCIWTSRTWTGPRLPIWSAMRTARSPRSGSWRSWTPGPPIRSAADLEDVAERADRVDQARLPVGLERLSDVADGDVDDVGLAQVLVAPDLLQQLTPAEHAARVAHQIRQQLEPFMAQLQPPFAAPG